AGGGETSPCRGSGCWKVRRCRRGQTSSRNRVPPGGCDKRRAEAVPSSRVRWHCALDRVQVAPLQAAKPWQAKLGLQPMTELNLQRKQAPGWGLVRLPELRLRRPKEAQVALVAAGSGTETQGEPGWGVAGVVAADLRPAEAERVAAERPVAWDPRVRAVTR